MHVPTSANAANTAACRPAARPGGPSARRQLIHPLADSTTCPHPFVCIDRSTLYCSWRATVPSTRRANPQIESICGWSPQTGWTPVFCEGKEPERWRSCNDGACRCAGRVVRQRETQRQRERQTDDAALSQRCTAAQGGERERFQQREFWGALTHH